MIITTILIIVACLLPLTFVLISRGRLSAKLSPDQLVSRMRPVDIEAFCNLVDPEEEYFLRSSLPPALFRSVQRERLLAAAEYVAAVSHNAAILLRVGEAARQPSDPSLVRAGQELANSAVRLRLDCSLVLLRLWTAILLPAAGLSPTPLAERYQHLSGLARRLGPLHYPAKTPGVSAVR